MKLAFNGAQIGKRFRRDGVHMVPLYAILHMFVDGICALAMFGVFIPQENGYFYMLLYNFCAFALQMPFGVVLDAVNQKFLDAKARGWRYNSALLTAIVGVLCTIAGAVTHPALLGIGNALFHVGGGVGTIQEDFCKGWKGRGLGVFVAPGAFGLFLGTLAGKNGMWMEWFLAVSIVSVLLCLGMIWKGKNGNRMGILEGAGIHGESQRGKAGRNGGEVMPQEGRNAIGKNEGLRLGKIAMAVGCFMVVILRSCLGMSVSFPWKTGMLAGTLGVLALVFGKMAGGFLAAKYGSGKIAVVSLAAAAVCYLFSSAMPMGLAALFLFNMTMPITLYWMACELPQMPGFAFGLLTFALFLGFLPGYFGIVPAVEGGFLGCMGSLLSLAVIMAVVRKPAFPGSDYGNN